MKRCEIEGCDREVSGTMNGIFVCERCRIHFGSVGLGAVYFDGRWHGVRGATYTERQCASHKGLKPRKST